MNERRRILVRGRVQAVGFRWFVRHSAESLHLDGWVRNLSDGRSVEAVAQGPRSQLDRLVDAMRTGPPGSFVSECTASPETPGDIAEGFRIVQ